MTATLVYHKLKRWIYRGDLPPGHRLIESELAARVGTSRIPLRESLRRLESEGLVYSIPHKATYVSDLAPDDIREILFMRRLLEPPAAGLASKHGTPRLFAYLRRLVVRMGEAAREGDLPALHQLDHRFHHAIVKAANCKRLLRAYESCHILIVGPRVGFQDVTGELTEQLHLKLVALMEARRADEAERYAAQVLDQSVEVLENYLANPPAEEAEPD